MLTIYKRELRALYLGYRGYTFTAIFAILYCVVKMVYNYFNTYAMSLGYFNAEYMLTFLPAAFALAVPVMTFSAFERERTDNAYAFLRSLPVKSSSVALAKYFSLVTAFFVPYAVLIFIDLVLGSYSGVSWGTVILSNVSFVLICNAILAISFFCGAILKNKFAALGVAYGVSVGYIGFYALAQVLPVGVWRDILLRISVIGTYTSAILGNFDFTALFFWLSVGGVFLWLSLTATKKEMYE